MKYDVKTPSSIVHCACWKTAFYVAKANQPSTILRGTYVITRFPWKAK